MGRWKTGRFLIASVVTAILIFSVLLVLLPVSAGSWPGANGKIALEVYQAFEGALPETDIFVVNPDGAGLKQLTDDGGSHNPDWSADGRLIAFDRSAVGQYSEIWVMNADGSGQRQVTHNEVDDTDPAWSRDGSKIAFERYDITNGDNELWVINADGTGIQQLTNGYSDHDPEWSPDGSKIAFERFDGQVTNIYVVTPDGSGLDQVTSGGDDHSPEWLPELGSRIAFERGGNIWTVKPDGTDEQQVTTGGNYYDPAWSPDGRKIAFAYGDIWVMNADGTGERMIVQALERQETYDPDWQPIARPVGGVVVPANKLAVLTPYLALISLVGAATVAAAVQKRPKP